MLFGVAWKAWQPSGSPTTAESLHSCAEQNEDHRIRQKDPNQGSARRPRMLATAPGTVVEICAMGTRLVQKNSLFRQKRSITEMYECKYAEATALPKVLEAELSINGERLMCKGVRARLWRELYGVSPVHPKLSRCCRRMVARSVTSLCAHNVATSQHHAVQSVQIVAGRSRNRVG